MTTSLANCYRISFVDSHLFFGDKDLRKKSGYSEEYTADTRQGVKVEYIPTEMFPTQHGKSA